MDNNKEIEKITSVISKSVALHLEFFLSLCESPIEKLFISNFIRDHVTRFYNVQFYFDFCNDPSWDRLMDHLPVLNDHVLIYNGSYCKKVVLEHSGAIENIDRDMAISHIELFPQYHIEGINNYRVDFLIVYHFPGWQGLVNVSPYDIKIVVECDGYEFHERTKEQATRDKQRDRDLTSLGYVVLRYTGSEINFAKAYTDFAKIVEQIEHIARKDDRRHTEQMKEAGKQYIVGNWRVTG